jgi:hypothetical protein
MGATEDDIRPYLDTPALEPCRFRACDRRPRHGRKDGTAMTIYEDRVLKLADLVARNTNRIEDTTFVNCQINGPAVVFAEDCEINNCTFDAPNMGCVVWPIPPDEPKVGGINTVKCIFEGCRFSLIGLALTPERAQDLLSEAA